jgi:hypothetical protein
MRYRLSRAWPLDHGRILAPSGTVIDSNSDDEWSRRARGLTPPWDIQALDDECYQLLLRAVELCRMSAYDPKRTSVMRGSQ